MVLTDSLCDPSVLVPLLALLFQPAPASSGYGAPAATYGAPEPSYGAPEDSYGAPHYSRSVSRDCNWRCIYFSLGPQVTSIMHLCLSFLETTQSILSAVISKY